jgi:hypothetical protein
LRAQRGVRAARPLFTEFAPQLLSHPAEVRRAHAPLLDLLATLIADGVATGELCSDLDPRRTAALTMATVMFTAQISGSARPSDNGGGAEGRPVDADEIWDFVAHGITGC